jgi:tripartite-type tricarboxylate transporter receptor subunit TctC
MKRKARNKLASGMAVFGVVLACLVGTAISAPKEYPAKPINLLVGTGPGGLIDLGARAWSDEFSKRIGVPLVISNMAGAGGTLAIADIAKATPDGYTLLAAGQPPVVIAPALSKLPYQSDRDIVSIGAFGITPVLIVVNANSPFKSIEELIEHARKNPGKLNCGTAGIGTIAHFDLELIKVHLKIEIEHVPFKGSMPAVTALLGNHVDMLTLTLPALPGHLKAGRIRALATTTKIPQFPDIPLFSEKGLGGAGIATWAGFFAPAGIPKNAHQKLATVFAEVVKDPVVIQRLDNVGFTPFYLAPEQHMKLIREELKTMADIAKKAGIKAEQ